MTMVFSFLSLASFYIDLYQDDIKGHRITNKNIDLTFFEKSEKNA